MPPYISCSSSLRRLRFPPIADSLDVKIVHPFGWVRFCKVWYLFDVRTPIEIFGWISRLPLLVLFIHEASVPTVCLISMYIWRFVTAEAFFSPTPAPICGIVVSKQMERLSVYYKLLGTADGLL